MVSKWLRVAIVAVLCTSGISAQEISELNDEFNDSLTLGNWSWYHETEGWPDRIVNVDINTTEPGALFMEPTSSGWYNDLDSPFMFKELEGDFVIHARIKTAGKSSVTPMRTYSLTGIFIRAPRDITSETWTAGQENWMFISTGAGDEVGVPKFEVKNTVDSQSLLELTPADTGWIEMRLQRLDDVFTVEYKYDGGDWTHLRTYEPPERPVMPERLQVGLVTYTDWESIGHFVGNAFSYKTQIIEGSPDIYSYVDFIRFSRPEATSIEGEELPETFRLNQNYPNPFNPETRITYRISEPADVELTVYNVFGQIVQVLTNEFHQAGEFSVLFNADGLSTGTYYYRLKVNGRFAQTRKMVFLK